jgi:hypothetical protein
VPSFTEAIPVPAPGPFAMRAGMCRRLTAGRTVIVEQAGLTFRVHDADQQPIGVVLTATRTIAQFKAHKPDQALSRQGAGCAGTGLISPEVWVDLMLVANEQWSGARSMSPGSGT